MQRKKAVPQFTVESQSEDEEISANEIDEDESEQEQEIVSENNDDDDDEQSDANEMDVAGPSGVNDDANEVKKPKKKKKGIIFISSIPKHMNVMIMREMLGQYAKIGRIFLQPGKLPGKFC